MASTVIDPVAQALSDLAVGLSIAAGKVRAYKWEVGYSGIGACPAVVVGLPGIGRTKIDEPESQLGANDWTLDFPVLLAVELDQAPKASAHLAEFGEAYIKAVDADPQFDGLVADAKVVDAEPVVITDGARPQLAYELRVGVLKLVSPLDP